jgi:hypothetical protein
MRHIGIKSLLSSIFQYYDCAIHLFIIFGLANRILNEERDRTEIIYLMPFKRINLVEFFLCRLIFKQDVKAVCNGSDLNGFLDGLVSGLVALCFMIIQKHTKFSCRIFRERFDNFCYLHQDCFL